MEVHCSKHPLDEAARLRFEELHRRTLARSPFGEWAFAVESARLSRLSVDVHFAAAGGSDLAAVIVPVRRIGPFRRQVVPRLTAYSALNVAADINLETERGIEALSSLAGHLAREYDGAALHLSPAIPDARPFQWKGWDSRPFYTYLLNLAGGSPQRSFSDGARRLFDRNCTRYRTTRTDSDGTARAIELCSAGYRRHGRAFGLREPAVQEAADRLIERGLASCFTTSNVDTGEAEAAVVLLLGERTAYYWIAGSNPGPSMTVLVAQMGDLLRERGITSLDMIGANTPSIAEFKRRLGSTLLPYYRVTSRPSLPLRLLERVGVGAG